MTILSFWSTFDNLAAVEIPPAPPPATTISYSLKKRTAAFPLIEKDDATWWFEVEKTNLPHFFNSIRQDSLLFKQKGYFQFLQCHANSRLPVILSQVITWQKAFSILKAEKTELGLHQYLSANLRPVALLSDFCTTKIKPLTENSSHYTILLSSVLSCPNPHFVAKSLWQNHFVTRSLVTQFHTFIQFWTNLKAKNAKN